MMFGTPIERDVTLVFGIAAAFAGIAGGLLTQTTQFVSPETMAFTRSADVLVMLVIGGAAVLYGASSARRSSCSCATNFPRSIRSTGTSGSGSCWC